GAAFSKTETAINLYVGRHRCGLTSFVDCSQRTTRSEGSGLSLGNRTDGKSQGAGDDSLFHCSFSSGVISLNTEVVRFSAYSHQHRPRYFRFLFALAWRTAGSAVVRRGCAKLLADDSWRTECKNPRRGLYIDQSDRTKDATGLMYRPHRGSATILSVISCPAISVAGSSAAADAVRTWSDRPQNLPHQHIHCRYGLQLHLHPLRRYHPYRWDARSCVPECRTILHQCGRCRYAGLCASPGCSSGQTRSR